MKIIVDELPRYGEKCPFDYQDSWGYRLCYKKDCPLKENIGIVHCLSAISL